MPALLDDSIFTAYETYIREKNCVNIDEEDFDPIHDIYSDANDKEGYKFEIAARSQYLNTKFWGQRRNLPHTPEEIFNYTENIIKLNNNLIDYRNKDTFLKVINQAKVNHDDHLAGILQDLYCTNNNEESFNELRTYCNRFDVLAYLFFTKDPHRFLPIRSSIFDEAFKALHIPCPDLNGPSWEKYQAFLNIITQIREQLIDRYPTSGISLLDAHNFVWVIAQYDITKTTPFFRAHTTKTEPLDKLPTVRKHQQTYRKNLFELWHQKCAITGCTNRNLLVASHIKPYAACDENEAYDPYNGILLARNYDALFDGGFITFHPESGEMQVSKTITKNDLEAMGIASKKRLDFTPAHRKYLEYHYKYVFIDSKNN